MAEICLQVTGKVVLVTGAYANEVSTAMNGLPVTIIHNDKFEEGIATSIKAGLKEVIGKHKNIEGVIFMVCDQPFISSSLLLRLVEKKEETHKGIIASVYAGTPGTPVLFLPKYFTSLLQLQGDAGAKKIILQHRNDLATIDFPAGETDIDTMKDYESLITNAKNHPGN